MTEKSNNSSARGSVRITIAIAILLVMGLAAAGYWYYFMRGIVFSDDARFDGDLLDIAPRINGVLTQVHAVKGDRVTAGQVLFVLDKEDLAAALTRAEAEVASARADLQMAEAQGMKTVNGSRPEEIRMAKATEQKAAAALNLATDEYTRFKALYAQHVVPTSQIDRAEAGYEESRRAHEEAVNRLELLINGSRKEDVDAADANIEMKKARLAVAEAGVRQARINLDYTEIVAPCDGVVVQKWASPGVIVPMGKPVLTIFNPSTLHVTANIEEKNLETVAVGNTVDISVDAYPTLKLTGRVEKIMSTANSEFSLIPAEGISGTYIKVAQRVPVRIAAEIPADLNIGPGLSVEVSIHVRPRSGS